ncbi:MAG: hypothetical protein ACXVDN_11145 [Ktedonobacteraceae bacterium]
MDEHVQQDLTLTSIPIPFFKVHIIMVTRYEMIRREFFLLWVKNKAYFLNCDPRITTEGTPEAVLYSSNDLPGLWVIQ